jgi:hypothetical protein
MIVVDAEVYGVKNAEARLKKAGVKTQDALIARLTDIGFLVQREGRKNAPYRDGDLEQSITFRTGRFYVDILVPANSSAGRYARVMHDGKYELGIKSLAKGGNVGRLYIKRAIDDNADKIKDQLRTIFRNI